MKEKILEILKGIRPEFDFIGVDDFFEEGKTGRKQRGNNHFRITCCLSVHVIF